jgi:hypothetical protein
MHDTTLIARFYIFCTFRVRRESILLKVTFTNQPQGTENLKIINLSVQKFRDFYGKQTFNTVLTKPATRPYPDPDESSQQHSTTSYFFRSTLILSYNLSPSIPSGIIPSR